MKKVAIVYSEYSPTIDAIIKMNEHLAMFSCFENKPDEEFDFVIGMGVDDCAVGINVHYSLLPSFAGEDPLRQAILAGVKVTGISFYYTNPFRLILQYPLIISNDMHFDDIQQELQYLEQVLYPILVNKILKNEQIDVKNILNKGCGGCSGCKR